jgi:hypothetical protein
MQDCASKKEQQDGVSKPIGQTSHIGFFRRHPKDEGVDF